MSWWRCSVFTLRNVIREKSPLLSSTVIETILNQPRRWRRLNGLAYTSPGAWSGIAVAVFAIAWSLGGASTEPPLSLRWSVESHSVS